MSKQGKASVLNSTEHTQFLQFLSNTRHPVRNQAIYLLSVRAGLRVQSIAGLLLNDVIDTSGNLREVVNLHSSIVKGGKNYTVYLTHPELREALTKYIFDRKSPKQVPNLFISQKGRAFTPNSLSHTLLKLYRDAGFDNGSSHSGRRSFATNVLKSGVDIVALKTLMNHSNISTTAEYVSHNDEYLKKVVMNV
jgi:integrase/recombinase XerD